MKRSAFIFLSISTLLSFAAPSFAADKTSREFEAKGQVVTVDPVYSQITIHHGAIKGFGGDTETVFYVESADLLKGLSRYDLVDFHFVDKKGDVRIDRMTKTGVASMEEPSALGEALHDTLSGAGEIARGITAPLPPAQEAVGGAFDATADTAGSALKDAPEQKQNF